MSSLVNKSPTFFTFVSSGGGLFGAKWENFSSARGDTIKSVFNFYAIKSKYHDFYRIVGFAKERKTHHLYLTVVIVPPSVASLRC